MILILSYYFKPDLSAGSFRATSFVRALKEVKSQNKKILVVTTYPSRYASYKNEISDEPTDENIKVIRCKVPFSGGSLYLELISFMYFSVFVFWTVRKYQVSAVYSTSSRLATGFLGCLVSKWKRVPFYLDLRDLVTDFVRDTHSVLNNLVTIKLFEVIEKITVEQACKVNLVSEGFYKEFNKKYPKCRVSFYTNGIDNIFLKNYQKINRKNDHDIKVIYAGNIGDGQALHKILPNLAMATKNKMTFHLYGDGRRRGELLHALNKYDINNVIYHGPIDRLKLPEVYHNADCALLHLDALVAFQKVLPSKIFEYAACGLPIWAGVEGYAKKFLLGEVGNVATFTPCDVPAAISSFSNLNLGRVDRQKFKEKFSRESISIKMAKDFMDIL